MGPGCRWMWEGVRDGAQESSWGEEVQGRQPWVVGRICWFHCTGGETESQGSGTYPGQALSAVFLSGCSGGLLSPWDSNTAFLPLVGRLLVHNPHA